MNLQTLKQRREERHTVHIDGTDWVLCKIMADTDPAEIFTEDTKDSAIDAGDNASARQFYARLLKRCVLNGEGLMFAEQTPEEVAGLLTWNELATLGKAALEFSGIAAKKN